ncbi:MAG: hypothetical protein NC212_01465 [Staphylococcus sp.]|nr:hypothetical protein [Staphylococcus sp.]
MKNLVLLVLCSLLAPFCFAEAPAIQLMKIHSQRFYTGLFSHREVFASEDIRTYPIGEEGDTVYLKVTHGDGRETGASIWKKNYEYSLFINPPNIKRIPFRKNRDDAKNKNATPDEIDLIENWETDLLRYLGKKAEINVIGPGLTNVTRVIYGQGALKIDTVKFFPVSYMLEKLSPIQLDSIRQLLKDSIESLPAVQVVSPDSVDPIIDTPLTTELPQKSLWQRIVDWFRALWNRIFG